MYITHTSDQHPVKNNVLFIPKKIASQTSESATHPIQKMACWDFISHEFYYISCQPFLNFIGKWLKNVVTSDLYKMKMDMPN